MLLEFERSAPVIVDRGLYRELAKSAIKRTVNELRAKATAAAAEKKAAKASASQQPADPVEGARKERDRQLRELSEQAHGTNLDLGASLLNGLSAVDPADFKVAKYFVYALLGPDHGGSPYTQQGEQIARLAASGIRLVIEEFRADVTKTRKDGSRGKLRIDYGEHRSPQQPIAWLWRFIDGARTAGELYGRALVVIAAEQHASRLVLPQSQRHPARRWSSHKDRAARALKTLTGPHLPASLAQLEKAVKRAHREYEHTEQAARERTRPHSGRRAPRAAATDTQAADANDTGRDGHHFLDDGAIDEADDTSELDHNKTGSR